MAMQNEFFTIESLLTFGGAVTATFIVPNTAQKVFNFNPRWLAFIVAELVCLGVVFNGYVSGAPTSLVSYVVAFVNGCLVYSSAMGSTSTIASVAAPAQPGVKGGSKAGESASFAHDKAGKVRREFLTPWAR